MGVLISLNRVPLLCGFSCSSFAVVVARGFRGRWGLAWLVLQLVVLCVWLGGLTLYLVWYMGGWLVVVSLGNFGGLILCYIYIRVTGQKT